MTDAAEPFPPIVVWPFAAAPADLRALSTNGGDEDWLAEVPDPQKWPAYGWIFWLEDGTPFGCYDVEDHAHPTRPGWRVRIGCHA